MKSGGNRGKTHNATKVGFQEKLLSPVRCMASSCGVPGVRPSQGPSDLRPSGSRCGGGQRGQCRLGQWKILGKMDPEEGRRVWAGQGEALTEKRGPV